MVTICAQVSLKKAQEEEELGENAGQSIFVKHGCKLKIVKNLKNGNF